MRETRTVSAGGARGRIEERGLSEKGGGGRGIASGAKIRFARCRLHPRNIATHLLSGPQAPFELPRACGTLPSASLPPRGPLYLPFLAHYAPSLSPSPPPPATLYPRAPPSLESSNEHRPLILPTATLLDPPPPPNRHPHIRRPNSIPYGLHSRPPFPFTPPLTKPILCPLSLFPPRITTFLSSRLFPPERPYALRSRLVLGLYLSFCSLALCLGLCRTHTSLLEDTG